MPDPRPIRDHFDPPQAPGEIGRLGKYRVLRELGAGGMGAVFAAEDTYLERPVALKFMAPELAAKPEARERFLREARAAARVRSEHVVAIHDVDERNGLPYIAMERLTGEPLDDLLDRAGPPPVPVAVRVGREVAEGLAAAHAAGLVHRDVKPSNVFLEAPHGTAKLIDFGLAFQERADSRLTATGQVLGTPECMAPEQAAGQPVDARADLFSLGVLLYRLATGVRPFAGPTVVASLASVLTVDPPPAAAINPHVPHPLSELIRGLMAKDPATRPPTARWVADALARMAAGLSPTEQFTAPPAGPGVSLSVPVPVPAAGDDWTQLGGNPPPAPPGPRPRRGTPGWVWAVAGLGAVLLVGLGGTAAVVATRGRTPVATGPDPTAPTRPATKPAEKPRQLLAPFTPAQARAAQAAWAKYLGRQPAEAIGLPGGLKLDLVLIPPGKFVMGSPPEEPARFPDEVPHAVEITKPFYLGKYEVTQEQYRAVMGSNPSEFPGDRQPVERVPFADAEAFCGKLPVRRGRAGLPSEAQWEYACRAGTTTPYHFGAVLNGRQANCRGEFPYGTAEKGPFLGRTREVGQYDSNGFGLDDMHGNVWEWCRDFYGPVSAVANPEDGQPDALASGEHIVRGGGWVDHAPFCRAALRHRHIDNFFHVNIGLRVCVRLE